MRLGLIGPETSVKVVQQAVEEQLPDIALQICSTAFFEESALLADQLQQSRAVDALLFTGPTNYAYAKQRVSETVPWGHLPYNRVSVLQALLEAVDRHGRAFHAISTDRYPEALVAEALCSVGVPEARVYRAPYESEEPDLERKLLEFHRECYHTGKADLCLTSMEHILEPLCQEGIPSVRIRPAKEIVVEQIYHLQLLNLSAQENHGRLAVIAVHYDYVFDNERDLMLREWEKMRYLNEFRERVYSIAQRLNAAVFDGGVNHFFIVTTRNMVEKAFVKNQEYAQLLQFGQRSDHFKVWIGTGVGDTMLEAKSRAAMALNRAVAQRSGSSCFAENEEGVTVLRTVSETAEPGQRMKHFAEHVGVSTLTLKKIAGALRAGEAVTSAELAEKLNVTARSANRLIARLEDSGCVYTVGTHTEGKGRPARVIRVALPDVFYEGVLYPSIHHPAR